MNKSRSQMARKMANYFMNFWVHWIIGPIFLISGSALSFRALYFLWNSSALPTNGVGIESTDLRVRLFVLFWCVLLAVIGFLCIKVSYLRRNDKS